MKIAEIFKKKTKASADTSAELDEVLTAIIKIEAKRDESKNALEAARKALQGAQATAIDGDEADIGGAVAFVISEKEKLDSLDGLLKQTTDKACGLVAAGSAAQRNRLVECESEIAEVRRAIDTRRIKIFSEFAKKHGLRFSLPSKDNSGAIIIPATVLGTEEIAAVADAAVVALHSDPDAARLDELQAERQKLTVLIGSPPPLALETLLDERRRG